MRRLLNALYRGGITAQMRPEVWGVWRKRDRRRCRIGTLAGADIDLLRLHEVLVPTGSDWPRPLIWGDRDIDIAPAMAILTGASSARPFLDQLVQQGGMGAQRSKFVAVARAIRRDCAGSPDPQTSDTDPDDSCARLSDITDLMTTEDCRFLHQFLNCRATKSDLAHEFDLRPAAVRTRAINILRAVTSVYGSAMSA